MKINNIKKDTQKTEAIRNLFNKEIPTYARKLRKAEDVFIENIYNEILTEEWMKIVDNKLEPLKLHEKIYLITEADTLEDLMDMLMQIIFLMKLQVKIHYHETLIQIFKFLNYLIGVLKIILMIELNG